MHKCTVRILVTCLVALAVTLALVVGCTSPPARKQVAESVALPDTGPASASVPVAAADTVLDEQPGSAAVPVEAWVGERFVALPMAPTFQRFGYELYPERALDEAPGAPDSTRQLANHRLRYAYLSGKQLSCVSVTPVDSEFLVAWTVDSTTDSVFARTHDGAVKGVAFARDLETARKRWSGKQIFARKRQINTYDSVSGKMGSSKVSIGAPLQVEEVRWGGLPLPPQPLWGVVSTPDSLRGFIPAYISWTNVLGTKVRDTTAWAEFIIERNPTEVHDWAEEIWASIDAHKLMSRMTRAQVRLCTEDPTAIDTVHRDGVSFERWAYPGQYLLFQGDTLVETTPR